MLSIVGWVTVCETCDCDSCEEVVEKVCLFFMV